MSAEVTRRESALTKDQARVFGEYIREVADLMGLCNWGLEVSVVADSPDDGDDGDAWIATCTPIPGRWYADLIFRDTIDEQDPEEIRQTVCHELLHCHFADAWHQPRMDLCNHLSQSAYDLFYASFRRNMEHGIDAVATCWAETLPLIDWKN